MQYGLLYIGTIVEITMTQAAARKRELLKPPEIKPVWTIMLMVLCMFTVGDPNKNYYAFCVDHSITAQKFMRAVQSNDYGTVMSTPAPAQDSSSTKGKPAATPAPAPAANPFASIPFGAVLFVCFLATTAQLGPIAFLLNCLFWWLLGHTVERKLMGWRFPAWILTGMLGSWALLAYEAEITAPTQRFIGPIMFLFYVLGGYILYRPKKPFKPAEWKPLPWKLFKDDEEGGLVKKMKVPFVSPWIYVGLFLGYVALMHFMTTLGALEFNDLLHTPLAAKLRTPIMGNLSGGLLQVMRPVPAIQAIILGAASAYVYSMIVFRTKVRREAGDTQVQAILQYKELRALDMTHKQAVEGTAKLLGVPLDIVKDWISKGLQTPPPEDKY